MIRSEFIQRSSSMLYKNGIDIGIRGGYIHKTTVKINLDVIGFVRPKPACFVVELQPKALHIAVLNSIGHKMPLKYQGFISKVKWNCQKFHST